MNPYFTSKAKRGILWRTPVALLCFLLPLVYLTRGILMRLDARRLARSFAGRLEDGIPMEKLQSELRMHDRCAGFSGPSTEAVCRTHTSIPSETASC